MGSFTMALTTALVYLALAVHVFYSRGSLVLGAVAGAELNPTGSQIGGGFGYGNLVPALPRKVVRNERELLDALRDAKSGDVIFVPDGVKIEIRPVQGQVVRDGILKIPAGVTLAGDRGEKAPGDRHVKLGGTITKLEYAADPPEPEMKGMGECGKPLFYALGPGVRITGLRLVGPNGGTELSPSNATAFCTDFPGTEVDNNEFLHWDNTAVRVGDYEHRYKDAFAKVHHNYIHHNRGSGQGYGVGVAGGRALIEANFFDYYRHAVSSSGYVGSGYEARYNIVGAHGRCSYPFDVHDSDRDRGNEDAAGDYVVVHHNWFFDPEAAGDLGSIHLEGTPRLVDGSWVFGNWFARSRSRFISQRLHEGARDEFDVAKFARINVFGNAAGRAEWPGFPTAGAGRPRLRQGDFNGDGWRDVISFGDDKKFRVWLGKEGGGFQGPQEWGCNGADLPECYRVADADGDGRSDVISFEPEPNGGVYVWLSKPGQHQFLKHQPWFSTGASDDCTFRPLEW